MEIVYCAALALGNAPLVARVGDPAYVPSERWAQGASLFWSVTAHPATSKGRTTSS